MGEEEKCKEIVRKCTTNKCFMTLTLIFDLFYDFFSILIRKLIFAIKKLNILHFKMTFIEST